MKYLLMAGLLLLGWPAAGQPVVPADSLAAARVLHQYQRGRQAESGLRRGLEYVNSLPDYFREHPFFLAPLPQRGSVVYRGQRYASVPLQYEEVQNCVVLPDSASNGAIRLFGEEVAEFTIAGHRFVRLPADSARAADFYEVLADGPVRLLATRHKQAVKHTTGRELTGELVVTDRYFVAQGRRLTEVSRLRQVVALLPDQRPALQQQIRSQRLSDRPLRQEADLAALVRYYNTLATKPD